jgi:hypothetical protein
VTRSALAVSGALVALGVVAWWLSRNGAAPVAPPAPVASAPAAPEPLPSLPVAPAGPRAAPAGPAIPRVGTREELAAALAGRGLDAEKFLAGYRNWRLAHGFLGPDPLAGLTAFNAPDQAYSTIDRSTLEGLAKGGDMGAMQAYAAGSLPNDPFTALEYYGRASAEGSAAALGAIAGILANLGDLEPGARPRDGGFAERLLALRAGDPNRDLRDDALAWTLAGIRLYGPILASPGDMTMLENVDRNGEPERVAAICARSLAILAEQAAATAGRDYTALPPVFVAERDIYSELPCRDTPAPVTPPPALAACKASPALGSGNRFVELWICPGD